LGALFGRPARTAQRTPLRGGGKEAKLEGRGRADPPPQLAAREEEGRRCWSDSAPSQELPRRDGGRDTAARVTDRVAARQTDAAKKKEVADDSGFLAIADGLAAVSLFGNPSTKEQHNPSSSSSTPPPRLVAPGTRVKDEEKEGGSWSRLRGERQCNFASPLSTKEVCIARCIVCWRPAHACTVASGRQICFCLLLLDSAL
jgi:hypothetical protein